MLYVNSVYQVCFNTFTNVVNKNKVQNSLYGWGWSDEFSKDCAITVTSLLTLDVIYNKKETLCKH